MRISESAFGGEYVRILSGPESWVAESGGSKVDVEFRAYEIMAYPQKLYCPGPCRTLTKRSLDYVNTEVFPGKLLSTRLLKIG